MMLRLSLGLLACGALTLATPAAAQQSWPNGPIRIVTPTPVGVGSDAFARLYAEQVGKTLKTSVYVENRPGASGTLGADAVAKAAPNGFTLLFSTSGPFTTAPALLPKIPYNPQKDFVPIAQLYRGGSFLLANPAFPADTLVGLITIAKQRAKSINYASYGPGSTAHLGIELLQDAAGIEMVHIPYRQSAIPDLIGGQVMIGWEPPVSAIPNVRAGNVKALAYSGDRRSPALPNVPTLSETFPGLEVFTWVGVWAPAGTPDAIVARLRSVFTTATQASELLKPLAEAGNQPMSTTPAEMAATIEQEAQSMGRLIKAKNITLN